MGAWWPRVFTVIGVPPVCSAYWGGADWHRITRVRVEPLRIEALGRVWRPCGRGADGKLLYAVVQP